MRFTSLLSIGILILVGCGAPSLSEEDIPTTKPYVSPARVELTKVFSHVHLRLCKGAMSTEVAVKTIEMVPRKRTAEYFAFFPEVPADLSEAIQNCSRFVEAEMTLKRYEGEKILVRRMVNGKLLFETGQAPAY